MSEHDKEQVRQGFAARFRQALAEIGYAPNEQARLQRLFGVSGQAVRKWAEGTSMPTLSRMPQVASALGVRRAWLQDGEGPMRPSIGAIGEEAGDYRQGKHQEVVLSKNDARLLVQYRELKPEQRKALEVIMASFAAAGKP